MNENRKNQRKSKEPLSVVYHSSSPGGAPNTGDAGPAAALPTVPSAGPVGRPQGPGQFAEIWRRFRRNRLAMVGLVIVAFLVVVAIISPFSTPYDPFV